MGEDLRGRGVETKSVVIVACEENGKGIGRIRLRRVEDCSAENLIEFVKDTVKPESTVQTNVM